jgi:methylglutaconyl-CoA hydratase/polyketide biosynthesis enoyl-CoA hydratase PksH
VELMTDCLRYAYRDGVATMVMACGERGNVLTGDLLAEIRRAVKAANCEPDCRVIVLRADGNGFCDGMDLDLFTDGRTPGREYFELFADCLKDLCRSDRPVLAAIHGETRGGGTGLAAACDLVIGEESAGFSLPEVLLGMIPALVTPVLLRRISVATLRALTLTTRRMDAAEAKQAGLVDEVVPSLDEAVAGQVERVCRSSSNAIRQARNYFSRIAEDALDFQMQCAVDEICAWLNQPGVLEGIQQFADGHAPPWTARRKVDQCD